MKIAVFTARSTGIAIAVAVLVGAALRFIDVPWGLAVLNGWAVGAVCLLVPVARRLGRFNFTLRQPTMPPWLGVYMVGIFTFLLCTSLVRLSVETDLATGFAFRTLFLLVGAVTWICGDVVATLDHLHGGAPAADARPNRPDAAR